MSNGDAIRLGFFFAMGATIHLTLVLAGVLLGTLMARQF